MTRKRNTSTAKARRDRRTHDEPLDTFWDRYEPVVSAGLLDDDLTVQRFSIGGWNSKPVRLPGKFDLDRMLWRPRTRFPDWDQVTDVVATGGMVKTKAEAEALVKAGITHVVNGATELYDEDEVFDGLPIEYLFNPSRDDNRWKGPEWFKAALDFARPAIAQGGNVYLHCLEGINRGPSLAAAVLMDQGMSARTAKEAIQLARPRAKIAYLADAMEARL